MSDPTTEELLTAFFTSTITGLDDDESRRGVLRTLVAHGDKIGADDESVSRVAAQLRSLDERSGGAFWPRLLLSGVGDGSGSGDGCCQGRWHRWKVELETRLLTGHMPKKAMRNAT